MTAWGRGGGSNKGALAVQWKYIKPKSVDGAKAEKRKDELHEPHKQLSLTRTRPLARFSRWIGRSSGQY
jgi:hypothetical protein